MKSDDFFKILAKTERKTMGKYFYEFWNQEGLGNAEMGLRKDGSFKIKWNGIFNMLARNGIRPGDPVCSVSYAVNDYDATGGFSYLCVYGWAYDSGTYDNMVEFYIVDNWKNFRPPGEDSTFYKTVKVDGDTYDIYTSIREDKPSVHPDGNSTFTQYWSVRREDDRRLKGTIDVRAHFRAWAEEGMSFGDTLYEVSFCIEGFGLNNTGAGSANVYELSFNTD